MIEPSVVQNLEEHAREIREEVARWEPTIYALPRQERLASMCRVATLAFGGIVECIGELEELLESTEEQLTDG